MESNWCLGIASDVIGKTVGRDILAASLVTAELAARLRVTVEVVIASVISLASSVYTEETGTSSGGTTEDGNGDVVPSGKEVTEILAEFA